MLVGCKESGPAAVGLLNSATSKRPTHDAAEHNNNNNVINRIQAFQLIIFVRYLLGVPNPSPVSQHALT